MSLLLCKTNKCALIFEFSAMCYYLHNAKNTIRIVTNMRNRINQLFNSPEWNALRSYYAQTTLFNVLPKQLERYLYCQPNRNSTKVKH